VAKSRRWPRPRSTAASFSKHNWLLVLLGIIAVSVAFGCGRAPRRASRSWHKAKLKIPFVGAVLSSSLHSQFLETLASLSSGGLPLAEGIGFGLARDDQRSTPTRSCRNPSTWCATAAPLSRALEATDSFPSNPDRNGSPFLGEQTGDLPAALRRAADRCAKEPGRDLEKVAAAMQPVIILDHGRCRRHHGLPHDFDYLRHAFSIAESQQS